MKNIKISIFLSIELILYISFLFLDLHENILPDVSSILKYIAIIFCALFSSIENIKYMHRLSQLNIALLFAATADVFLLFTSYYTVGILLFIIVQICYYKFLWKSNNYLAQIVFVCAAISLLATLILKLFHYDFQLSTLIAIFYFSFLFINLIKAIKNGMKSHAKKDIFFAAALFLLFFCDLNVGIHNLQILENTSEFSIFVFLKDFSNIGMWLFYLPSQVIITILSLSSLFSYDDKKDIEKYYQ